MRTKTLFVAILSLLLPLAGASAGKGSAQDNSKSAREEKKVYVKELTAEGFKTSIMDYEDNPSVWKFKGKRPAIIDFYAVWCGPCKATAPVFEELARKYDGKVDFYKVDVDNEKTLAALFGIRSIPALLFIPLEGKPQMHLGAVGRNELDNAIINVLLPEEEE
ncbi:MAG: thioredoxin family protein [Candidatus Cryptobacteroides sp.]